MTDTNPFAAAVPADLTEAGKVVGLLRAMPIRGGLHGITTASHAADLITALLARIAAQEAQMTTILNEREGLRLAMEKWVEESETALAAERAKVAKLVEYYEASEAILSIEAEWRSRKADGLLDGSNIFNLTDKLTAAEARLAKARAAITEAGHE